MLGRFLRSRLSSLALSQASFPCAGFLFVARCFKLLLHQQPESAPVRKYKDYNSYCRLLMVGMMIFMLPLMMQSGMNMMGGSDGEEAAVEEEEEEEEG